VGRSILAVAAFLGGLLEPRAHLPEQINEILLHVVGDLEYVNIRGELLTCRQQRHRLRTEIHRIHIRSFGTGCSHSGQPPTGPFHLHLRGFQTLQGYR